MASNKYRYSASSYERGLASFSRVDLKSTSKLDEGDPGMAPTRATRRNKVTITPPNNANLDSQGEDNSNICLVCANLDPWSRKSALGFV